MSKIPWYVARSSGVVAWALIIATIVWGLLLATRVLGRKPAPAWLLSLHRYLGALALVFVGVHVGAILLDSYTNFGIVDVLVPFTGSWHPLAVAWGIVGMYLLVAIEVTSLLRHRLSNRVWHGIHLMSYFLFGVTTVHMLTAGTDAKAILASTTAVLLGTIAVFGSAALYLWRTDPGEPRALARSSRMPVRTSG
jgi:DMSO/TMAO reductase YedYZ heme-binding membrane subunit